MATATQSAPRAWAVGDKVWWHREYRGGWGYVHKIYAVVVGLGKSKVTVAVWSDSDAVVCRSVSPDKLSPRPQPHTQLDDLA